MLVRFNDDEFDAVRRTADLAGLAVGAWAGEAAVRAADRTEWELGMSRREVLRQLVRVRLDVALARRVVAEVGPAAGGAAVTRPLDDVLARLDELIDRAVDDAPR
ncbi:hypothetical protein [Pseudonocardia lacus]|uniref:hypothetical protein n=1 Tax=Pseudonocardia lacus TaxID=2835865 RepID=UPI001BDD935D|nr:hypothetical protein [Pseudonocardia lacus]